MSDDEGMTPSRPGSGAQPTRSQSDLADVIEILLEKGVVINADIAVSIGDTELLGVQIRAALASFETAAEYGLEFPTGTDMRRVEHASGREELDDEEVSVGDSAIEAESDGEDEQRDEDEGANERSAAAEGEGSTPESDGGSPVAPLHPPPVAENAPWLKTPPVAEDANDAGDGERTDDGKRTDDGDRSRVEPGVSARPSESDEATEDPSDADGDETGEGETGGKNDGD